MSYSRFDGSQVQERVWRFFKGVSKFWNFKTLSFCMHHLFTILYNTNYCHKVTVIVYYFISSWIVNKLQKIFSRIKLSHLFTNSYLSLARLVSIKLLPNLIPRWNNFEINCINVISTLFQRLKTTLYQRYATLKIRRQVLFHFQCWINFISAFIHNVETTLIRSWNVAW